MDKVSRTGFKFTSGEIALERPRAVDQTRRVGQRERPRDRIREEVARVPGGVLPGRKRKEFLPEALGQ